VEKQIAKPLEEVFATLGDVREIFSESSADGAFVGVIFDWGRDVNVLRMEVKEKVDQIRGELPDDIERIQLFTFNSNDQPIMVGRISASGVDLMNSYDLLEKTVINPLKRIEGVGRVGIDGVEPQEIAIYLELDKIKAHRVDVDRLFGLIQTMNVNASIGEVTSKGLRYNVRGLGSFASFEDIENLVINEERLRLKDVATIYYGVPLINYGRHLNGEPCVAFWIQKASDANSVELGRRVQEQLDKINKDPRLEGINILLFWNQSEQIQNSLNGLRQAGIIGAFFAIVILYFRGRFDSFCPLVHVRLPVLFGQFPQHPDNDGADAWSRHAGGQCDRRSRIDLPPPVRRRGEREGLDRWIERGGHGGCRRHADVRHRLRADHRYAGFIRHYDLSRAGGNNDLRRAAVLVAHIVDADPVSHFKASQAQKAETFEAAPTH
jgi:multidrug efflux pump subunit AcrB